MSTDVLDTTNLDDLDDEDIDYLIKMQKAAEAGRLQEFYVFTSNCGQSVIEQILPEIKIIFIYCIIHYILVIISKLISNKFKSPQLEQILLILLHVISAQFGIQILTKHFDISANYPFIFLICANIVINVTIPFFILLTRKLNRNYTNLSFFIVSLYCLIFVFYCEFYLVGEIWHKVRGVIMILSMKSISYVADEEYCTEVSNIGQMFTNSLLFISYLLSPATLIFGPWISFQQFLSIFCVCTGQISTSHFKLFIKSSLKCMITLIEAFGFLLFSTCISSFIFDEYESHKWINAFSKSQSYRFGHYFVCFLSETFLRSSGYNHQNPVAKCDCGRLISKPNLKETYATYLATDLRIVHPLSIELPRSLVEVVIQWNVSMHIWLKHYIYKPFKGLNKGVAILITYSVSSLLHGLNFQLAAVLFSIGIYSYIEFVFREKLANIFNACIRSRICHSKCLHKRKNSHPISLIFNVSFSLLAVFHLAYLAVTFDTSAIQDKGYNMVHVLEKWSSLGFTSHLVAGITLMIHLIINKCF